MGKSIKLLCVFLLMAFGSCSTKTTNEEIQESTRGSDLEETKKEEQDQFTPLVLSSLNDLNDFYITYPKTTNFNEDLIANELRDALYEKCSVKVKMVRKGVLDERRHIFLKVDSSIIDDVFIIKKEMNSFVLTSNSNIGLIEACRHFLAECSSNANNIGSWYINEYKKNYYNALPAKIMSYNVRSQDDGTLGNGDSGNIDDRYPRVLKCIQTHSPDSVGVQEATDKWMSKLKDGLFPKYGYVGWGRDSNYKGERCGIFYNRDKLTLLESKTKWFSNSPDSPGSHFSDYGGYNRIMTYAIFKRNSDDYIYMHVNTHFDLERNPRIKDADCVDKIISPYKNQMSIFLTGDLNITKDVDDGVSRLINHYNYVDSFDEAKDVLGDYTFPTKGYRSNWSEKDKRTIDFGLRVNKGMICSKYLVDTNKYSGDGVERPQITSDHYPLYFEAMIYNPLIPFENYNQSNAKVRKNNAFSTYDHKFNFIKTSSPYSNRYQYLAINATYNGSIKTNRTTSQYDSVGSLEGSGKYIEYKCIAKKTGKADLNMILASVNSNGGGSPGNYMTPNLSEFVSLTINGSEYNLSNISLRSNDIDQYYEWEQLNIKDVDMQEGINTIKVTTISERAPNHLMLDVYSNVQFS